MEKLGDECCSFSMGDFAFIKFSLRVLNVNFVLLSHETKTSFDDLFTVKFNHLLYPRPFLSWILDHQVLIVLAAYNTFKHD